MDKFDAEFLYILGRATDSVSGKLDGLSEPLTSAVGRLDFAINARYLVQQLISLGEQLKVSPATSNSVIELIDLLSEATPDGFLERVDPAHAEHFAQPFRNTYASEVKYSISKFDTHLRGDFLEQNLYRIAQTGAYDTKILLEKGERMLSGNPEALRSYPQVLEDVRSSARCLTFELWTAAGFHIARATEGVLQEYWKHVRRKTDLPVSHRKTWVALCRELQSKPAKDGKPEIAGTGDQALVEFLLYLGQNYRNPLIHPEHSLDAKDCGLLLEGCKATIIKMLDVLHPSF